MEVDYILTDKMMQFCFTINLPVGVKIDAFLIAQMLEGSHIANRSIYPNVEVLFTIGIGDGKTEVRRITTDIPLLQTSGKPFLQFIANLWL